MIMISYWPKRNGGHLEQCILWARDMKSMFVCFLLSYQLPGYEIFFGWLVGWLDFYGNVSKLFNAKSIFREVVSSISNNSV